MSPIATTGEVLLDGHAVVLQVTKVPDRSAYEYALAFPRVAELDGSTSVVRVEVGCSNPSFNRRQLLAHVRHEFRRLRRWERTRSFSES